jgi:hypothetical protein
MPELSSATGWYPWLPLTRIELGHTPYNYERVEICRADFDAPQVVDPHRLHPAMNTADLWWRPLPGAEDPSAWIMPDDRQGVWISRPSPSHPTLATLLAHVEALSLFVGYDPAGHAPLDETCTIDDRLRTIDTALELMQGQLAEVLALLRAIQEGR